MEELPQKVMAALGGPVGSVVAIVASSDPDGGARMAPIGSLRATTPRELRFGCDHAHHTFANLRRNPPVTISLVVAPDVAVSIRGRSRVVKGVHGRLP